MSESFHTLLHFIGLCGENHPSLISYILGHTEVGYSIQYILNYFRK